MSAAALAFGHWRAASRRSRSAPAGGCRRGGGGRVELGGVFADRVERALQQQVPPPMAADLVIEQGAPCPAGLAGQGRRTGAAPCPDADFFPVSSSPMTVRCWCR